MTQQQVADALEIRREMWAKYEAGAEPGASVLGRAALAGVDVNYVVTGRRDYVLPPSQALSTDEQRVLALFKLASPAVRRAAVGVLATGELPGQARRGEATLTIHGQVGQQIKGDITAPQSFQFGDVAVPAPAAPAPAVKRVRKPRIDR